MTTDTPTFAFQAWRKDIDSPIAAVGFLEIIARDLKEAARNVGKTGNLELWEGGDLLALCTGDTSMIPPEWRLVAKLLGADPAEGHYIDVRFHFDKIEEDGYDDYELKSVERIGTNIPQDEFLGIGECLGQSDRWHVGGVNATLGAMVDEPGPHKIEDYH